MTYLVILDPAGNAPVFLVLTAGMSEGERKRAALQAVLTAAGVVAFFALAGEAVFRLLGISLASVTAAGGFLLLLVALDLLKGRPREERVEEDVNVALVPLGTPLLAGPGAIAATILFARQVRSPEQGLGLALGFALALLVAWGSLRFAASLVRLLKPSGVHLLTRVMGILLTAISLELLARGAKELFGVG